MKKILKFLFVSIVCLVLFVVVGGYIALTKVDFNSYKSKVIEIVYEKTNRNLNIGNIKVKLSLNPTISLENVEFSNANWGKEKDMVKVDRIDVGFAIIPLLEKNIVVDKFVVKNAVVNLEENDLGENNWTFSNVKKIEVTKKRSYKFEIINSANADDGAGALSSLVIKEVDFDNVLVNYTPKSGKKEAYKVKKLSLVENDKENIDFVFNVNDGLYEGKGVVGALKLLESNMGYPVVAKLGVMGINIDADVKLFNVLSDISFDGKIKAVNFLGSESFYNEKLDVYLKGDLAKIDVNVNSLNIAGNEVKGDVRVNLANNVPGVNIVLNSHKIDIDSFKKKVAFNFIEPAYALENRVDVVVPYEYFYKANVDAKFVVDEVTNKANVLASNVMIDAKLKGGLATINLSKAKVSEGEVDFNASLNASDRKMLLKTNIDKLNALNLMQSLGVNSDVFNIINGGLVDVYVDLTSTGNTKSELIGGLNGKSVVIVNKSEVYLGNIGLMKGNIISQLLNSLNLTKGEDNLALNCAVVRADVKNGVFDFPDGIAVNADKFTLVANGDVNLNNEKIDVSFKPFAGKITDTNIAKALSSLVKLTGTISKPNIGIDSASAIKAFVGVTTAGPIYLGAQMIVESDGTPCYSALVGTGYETRFPKPQNIVKSTPENVEKVLNNSVDLVKDTTKGLLNLLSGSSKKSNK